MGDRYIVRDLVLNQLRRRLGEGIELAVDGDIIVSGENGEVTVRLDERLLERFWSSLNEDTIPGLDSTEPDRRDLVCAKYMAIWIEELLDLGQDGSVRQVFLRTSPAGETYLDVYRGEARVPRESIPDGGSWHLDPPPVP